MKKVIFILTLLSFTLTSQSQDLKSIISKWDYVECCFDTTKNISSTPIAGFWNLTFGMTQSQVTSVAKYKPYFKDADGIFFNNTSLGGISFASALINFYKGKLYYGVFINKELNEEKVIRDLNSISKGLVEKYGNPETSVISDKKFYSFWKDKNNNVIFLSIIEEQNVAADRIAALAEEFGGLKEEIFKRKYSFIITYTYEKILSQKEKDEKSEL